MARSVLRAPGTRLGLLSAAEEAGIVDWAVAVDSTIAVLISTHEYHPHTGGSVEPEESAHRAADHGIGRSAAG